MDPLSQLLVLLDARAALSTGLSATGRWSVDVPATGALKCNVVRHGEALLQVAGTLHQLAVGDCFLVAPGHAFAIGTDLARPRPAAEVFAGPPTGLVADLDGGRGPAFRCIGGRMDMGPLAYLLGDALPPVIVLQATHPASQRIDGLLSRVEAEMMQPAAGSTAIAAAAMQMIFVDLIRSLPEDAPRGWLKALEDPRIGPALRAIHSDPSRQWRLEDLAGLSHLSRSQFTARFHKAVGRAPIDYLLHWRMALAQRALSRPGVRVSQVAADLGYASESAFGAAFRRVTGTSPRHAADRLRPATPEPPVMP